ncbi:DUF1059 domain-containing protein [Herbiconiux moechotypicola]|nr:DUF1059 domain-containing protein [Herbiconiux moechotypicola]MCS5729580.1 DUF1059 domain-containing protein [Herbiconiux moechotypicola]
MKAFACGDVVPGCAASWTATSDDDLLVLVGAHAHAAHGIEEVTPELVDSVTRHIVALS